MAGKRLPTFVRRKIEDRERWLHRRQALGLPDYQPPSREEIEARERAVLEAAERRAEADPPPF